MVIYSGDTVAWLAVPDRDPRTILNPYDRFGNSTTIGYVLNNYTCALDPSNYGALDGVANTSLGAFYPGFENDCVYGRYSVIICSRTIIVSSVSRVLFDPDEYLAVKRHLFAVNRVTL